MANGKRVLRVSGACWHSLWLSRKLLGYKGNDLPGQLLFAALRQMVLFAASGRIRVTELSSLLKPITPDVLDDDQVQSAACSCAWALVDHLNWFLRQTPHTRPGADRCLGRIQGRLNIRIAYQAHRAHTVGKQMDLFFSSVVSAHWAGPVVGLSAAEAIKRARRQRRLRPSSNLLCTDHNPALDRNRSMQV